MILKIKIKFTLIYIPRVLTDKVSKLDCRGNDVTQVILRKN